MATYKVRVAQQYFVSFEFESDLSEDDLWEALDAGELTDEIDVYVSNMEVLDTEFSVREI